MSPAAASCTLCEKEILEEHSTTVLVCVPARNQAAGHETEVHDRCWERFKKKFVRGRGTQVWARARAWLRGGGGWRARTLS